jgi:hypothetical protein
VAANGLGTLDAVLDRLTPWLDRLRPSSAPIVNGDARS